MYTFDKETILAQLKEPSYIFEQLLILQWIYAEARQIVFIRPETLLSISVQHQRNTDASLSVSLL